MTPVYSPRDQHDRRVYDYIRPPHYPFPDMNYPTFETYPDNAFGGSVSRHIGLSVHEEINRSWGSNFPHSSLPQRTLFSPVTHVNDGRAYNAGRSDNGSSFNVPTGFGFGHHQHEVVPLIGMSHVDVPIARSSRLSTGGAYPRVLADAPFQTTNGNGWSRPPSLSPQAAIYPQLLRQEPPHPDNDPQLKALRTSFLVNRGAIHPRPIELPELIHTDAHQIPFFNVAGGSANIARPLNGSRRSEPSPKAMSVCEYARCRKTFQGDEALKEHLHAPEPNGHALPRSKGKSTVREDCKWPGCNQRLGLNNIARHVITIHVKRRWPCPHCPEVKKRDDQLSAHLKKVHGI